MNNRLQQFLELENITPARLADTLGVQRSGLSHILSGRNKPGYEFLTKILTKFPHINSEWLLLGKGKPYKNFTDGDEGSSPNLSNRNRQISNSGNSGFASSSQKNNMYDSILYNSIQDDRIPYNSISENSVQYNGCLYDSLQSTNPPIFDENGVPIPEAYNAANGENTANITDFQHNIPNIAASQPSENCVNKQNCTVGSKKKSIKRVIVFYSDGSFEELFPHIR